MGVGHTDSESALFFLIEKTLTNCFLVLLTQTGFELSVFGSRARRSTN